MTCCSGFCILPCHGRSASSILVVTACCWPVRLPEGYLNFNQVNVSSNLTRVISLFPQELVKEEVEFHFLGQFHYTVKLTEKVKQTAIDLS